MRKKFFLSQGKFMTYLQQITDARHAPARPLVLVADDDPDTRLLFRTVLEMRGYWVSEAGDGEETVSAAMLKGRKVNPKVRVLVVPGSQEVKRQAMAEGLPDIFRDAGCDCRAPVCAACPAMNGAQPSRGQYGTPTSTPNFEGRQGKSWSPFIAMHIEQ